MIMTCERCGAEDGLQVHQYEVLCTPCVKARLKGHMYAGFVVIIMFTVLYYIGQRILK